MMRVVRCKGCEGAEDGECGGEVLEVLSQSICVMMSRAAGEADKEVVGVSAASE